MKIEIGESLLLSWLRHAKNCQLVQTNWKPSVSSWRFENEEAIKKLMDESKQHFIAQYGYEIYKANSLEQLIQQAEVDVLGICYSGGGPQIYGIDVAFHEAGLNYGAKDVTIMRVIKKCLRTVMCIYGYFGFTHGEIVFASPKIHNSIMEGLMPCLKDAKELLKQNGLDYEIRVIANQDFQDKILQPVLTATELVADTSELFMRSIQMYNLFAKKSFKTDPHVKRETQIPYQQLNDTGSSSIEASNEMKIGALVRSTLIKMFLNNEISKKEVDLMQTEQYSKTVFDLQYPLLRKSSLSSGVKPLRYWSGDIEIYGIKYFLCSEWYEKPPNNDRPYFMKWLKEKKKTAVGS